MGTVAQEAEHATSSTSATSEMELGCALGRTQPKTTAKKQEEQELK